MVELNSSQKGMAQREASAIFQVSMDLQTPRQDRSKRDIDAN